MSVNRTFSFLVGITLALPYVGPSLFGLGTKPLWFFFIAIPIFLFGRAKIGLLAFVILVFLFEILRNIGLSLESIYGYFLWAMMFAFVFSAGIIERKDFTQKELLAFQSVFYGLFLCSFFIFYLSPQTYQSINTFFVGQTRGTDDAFTFLSPESGLGAFSVLTVAFAMFHLTKEKSYWQLIIPCVCFLMIASATAYGLTVIWMAYFFSNTRISFSRAMLLILVVPVVVFVVIAGASDRALERFDALVNFDISGASSVSIRARDLLRLMDFGVAGNVHDGPVGIVKAAMYAPGFAILLTVFLLFYCKFRNFFLIVSALIFVPVTHPFVWVVLFFSRKELVRK